MKVSKKINDFRRKLMRTLTLRLGSARHSTQRANTSINRILISRPNGRLGNLLLITPLVQEIAKHFPDSKIDLFVKGNAAPLIFKEYPQVDQIIRLPGKPFSDLFGYAKTWLAIRKHRYDIVINVDPNSSSGRLSTLFSKSKIKIFGDEEKLPNDAVRHIAKAPVCQFRRLLPEHIYGEAVPTINLQLTDEEVYEGKRELLKITNNHKRTICIFTFATGNKCYSKIWWDDFYRELNERYEECNIIEILPAHNESSIDFVAPSFYSKDLRAITALIANTALFIGADSGMMHLASASQTPVVGLFSVTNLQKYQPYGNSSIAINTNHGSLSDWMVQIDQVLSETGKVQK